MKLTRHHANSLTAIYEVRGLHYSGIPKGQPVALEDAGLINIDAGGFMAITAAGERELQRLRGVVKVANYVSLPVEPTPEMLASSGLTADRYRALLKAAPTR
ncbi:MAG: hypothetical protein RSE94_11735 [Pseudomonas sp.]